MRMRVTFATDDSIKYVGHLDFARSWERAIRRARLPLAYSKGFHPLPRIQFAAALPVGFTGAAEIVDIYLDDEMEPALFLKRLEPALPSGVRLVGAEGVPKELPSLQSLVCGASYRVEVETVEAADAFQARLESFLTHTSVWRERRRGNKVVRYDLRPLVIDLSYQGPSDLGQAFTTSMRTEPGATGRPDDLLAVLGFESAARRINRLGLAFGGA